MTGKFIVFEGIDGSGKSTQFEMFCDNLREKGYKIMSTHEPTSEMIGELIRNRLHKKNDIPKKLDGTIYGLLFYADRIEHNYRMKKKMEEESYVVSDRYYHSSLAYQRTQGIDFEFLLKLHEELQKKKYVMKPDLTFLIDVKPEESLDRINKRNKKKMEIFEHLEFLKKLRNNYLDLENILDEKIEVIDGSGSIEEVQKRVWNVWKKYEK